MAKQYAFHKTLITLLALIGFVSNSVTAEETVKVFILAGQSNIEGKAKNTLLDYQVTQDSTIAHYAPYRKDGKWAVRDDVWIKYLKRHGGLL